MRDREDEREGKRERERDRNRNRTEERRKRALSTSEPCSSHLRLLHHRPPFFSPPATLYLSFSSHPAPSSLLFRIAKKCCPSDRSFRRSETSYFSLLLFFFPRVHLRSHPPPPPSLHLRYQRFRSLSVKDAKQKQGASAASSSESSYFL